MFGVVEGEGGLQMVEAEVKGHLCLLLLGSEGVALPGRRTNDDVEF